jgi:DNA-binding response OmpR family regulator
MLPDGSGPDLCAELRAAGDSMPILMLTARSGVEDRVVGLDAGADDYLKKPYRLRELLVRLRALARRSGVAAPEENDVVTIGSLRIHRAARQVTDEAGVEVPMTKTELDLLVLFIESAGRALSRNEILDAVWGKDVVVDERTVDNFVSSLKKKLRWTPSSPFSIRTVRGVGYRMELA